MTMLHRQRSFKRYNLFCLSKWDVRMEATDSSKPPVHLYQTIRRHNPKDINLHENHKDFRSQKVQFVSQQTWKRCKEISYHTFSWHKEVLQLFSVHDVNSLFPFFCLSVGISLEWHVKAYKNSHHFYTFHINFNMSLNVLQTKPRLCYTWTHSHNRN